MSFSIVRVAKVKSKVNTTGLQKHIQRENENYENKDINHDKTYLNYDLVNESDIDFNQKIDEKIEENYNGKRKIRSDAVKHIDGLITSDNEFFDNKSPDEIKAFFTDAKQFIEDEYGQQNLLYATVHMDEKTPHMHYGVVPITDDGRLSAKDVVGNKKALTQFQDRFNQYLNDKGHNLERGISKYKTQEEHKSVEKFKKDTNYHQEVEKKAIKKREQQEKATEKVVNALKELKTEGRKELQNFNSIKQRKEDLQKELEEYELKKEREQEQIDTYKANREQIRVDIEKQKEKHQEMLNVLNEPVNVKYEYEYKKASLFSGERHKTDNVIVSKSTLDQLQEQAMLGRRIAPHYERLQNGEE
ncbi:MobV family relaxase, partial [Staphylococcus saprophyticus]|uniref:MobV family relaxase n=8 Tax=cellular organisms TaxID=131567 RepID=UPI0022EA7FE9